MTGDNQPLNRQVIHPFAPVFDPDSQILILGSIPSVRSRRQGFYYGNPQNRFWRVLECILGDIAPQEPGQRRDYLLSHHIALWDVLRQCSIEGSQDSSIREPQANDLTLVLSACQINRIFTNGLTATRYYREFCEPINGLPCTALPSTSPANGRWDLAGLCREWQVVREALERF